MKRRVLEIVVDSMVRFLPGYTTRGRYRRELLAELSTMSGRGQVRFLLGIAVSLPSLRRELANPSAAPNRLLRFHSSLLCRARLSHRFKDTYTEDGQHFQCCSRCGIDSPYGPAGSPEWLAPIGLGFG